jgi:hypothetical protein
MGATASWANANQKGETEHGEFQVFFFSTKWTAMRFPSCFGAMTFTEAPHWEGFKESIYSWALPEFLACCRFSFCFGFWLWSQFPSSSSLILEATKQTLQSEKYALSGCLKRARLNWSTSLSRGRMLQEKKTFSFSSAKYHRKKVLLEILQGANAHRFKISQEQICFTKQPLKHLLYTKCWKTVSFNIENTHSISTVHFHCHSTKAARMVSTQMGLAEFHHKTLCRNYVQARYGSLVMVCGLIQ